MSEMTISVLDANRAVSGRMHGSCAERLIAALSVEPATIEELEAGLERFCAVSADRSVFDFFHNGVSEEWWDAGVLVIDLPARLVAMESTYFALSHRGTVKYHVVRRG